MRIALVNQAWSFENSIHVGCRSPHLPLELGACKVPLERAGHETLMLDGALDGLSLEKLVERVAAFAPATTAVTTVPTDLSGRAMLDKKHRASTDDLAERPIHARRTVPFVQANLIEVAAWRDRLCAAGVWADDPVPLSPCPSSPDCRRPWGEPDGEAWERAHAHDLGQFDRSSDIQEERPSPLRELEAACCPA